MVNVTGVRFKSAGKVYYFDPVDFDVQPDMGVIVETARGLEYGTVTMPVTPVKDEDISRPLKKIVRIADEKDIRRHEENEQKKGRAMEICQENIRKHNLEMKLIDVEYTFDNNKIIFYFTADGRVDFRELVKDLAGIFRMRIELRQVGVRDEAKMLGGVGCCGRGLCCATWLSDFEPVSIKMAKTQNLSLNPTKISGVCGRLMCCLKYENEVYKELRQGLPELNEKVETPEGLGKVIESNVLGGKVRVRIYTGEKEENGADKLGSDIYTFTKDEVRRLDRRELAQNMPANKEKAGAPGGRKEKQKEGGQEGHKDGTGAGRENAGSRRSGSRRESGRKPDRRRNPNGESGDMQGGKRKAAPAGLEHGERQTQTEGGGREGQGGQARRRRRSRPRKRPHSEEQQKRPENMGAEGRSAAQKPASPEGGQQQSGD